ncbi:MAG: hypothetical protein K2N72_12035 [Oscillospiraceae bacterium]|nr:hypothetical protein [Oscillospiraceae bacterium]
MNIKKTTLAILLTLTLSACSEANVTDVETETAAAQTETSSTQTETTAAETSDQAVETTAELTETSAAKTKPAKDYFEEQGYKLESSTLYIDMNNFTNSEEPLVGIDEEYLKKVHFVTVENAGSSDLSFLKKYSFNWFTLEGYSGNADFSEMDISFITLDDYKGGDLTSLPEYEYLRLKFKNYSGNEDMSFIADLKSIHHLVFENYRDESDLDFIADCPNITSLNLINKSINAEAVADVIQNSNIKTLSIKTEDYSSKDADIIMRAAPTCAVRYYLDDSPWSDGRPEEGITFFTNMYFSPDHPGNWECQTADASTYYPEIWRHSGSLVCTFSNFTEEVQRINSAEIFKYEKGVLTPIPFSDGSLVYDIDFTIDPGTNSDYEITNEVFPFNECETGIYTIAFNSDGGRLEQKFVIHRSGDDFLTEEQHEAVDTAYEITKKYFGYSIYMPQEYADEHTVDDFLSEICLGYTYDYAYSTAQRYRYIDENGNLQAASSDKGGDISYQGSFLMPIYSDDNEVLFKDFIIHGHEDNPYFIWFEEVNYHMVKTENGWRFDNFQF